MKVKFKFLIEREDREGFRLEDEINIPDGLTDEELGFDMQSFAEIVFNLLLLATCKNIEYGGSWRKRSEIRGPISNMDRKWDRISNSIEQWEKYGKNDPSPRLDGTADLAVYCLLYLSSFLRQRYPEQFEKWWQREVQDFLDKHRLLRPMEKQGPRGFADPKVA